jgi:hypothetical protein
MRGRQLNGGTLPGAGGDPVQERVSEEGWRERLGPCLEHPPAIDPWEDGGYQEAAAIEP